MVGGRAQKRAHARRRVCRIVAVVARQRLKANEVFINTENTPYLHDSESKLTAHARIVIAIDVCNMIRKKQVHIMAKCCPAHTLYFYSFKTSKPHSRHKKDLNKNPQASVVRAPNACRTAAHRIWMCLATRLWCFELHMCFLVPRRTNARFKINKMSSCGQCTRRRAHSRYTTCLSTSQRWAFDSSGAVQLACASLV
jgi:hypothetical protein